MLEFIMKKEKKQKNRKAGFKMKEFWLRLWKFLEPMHKSIRRLLYLIIIIEIIHVISPYILKIIIDLILEFERENISAIILFVFLMFGVNIVNSVFGFFAGKKAVAVSAESENYLYKKAHDKMLNLSLNYHEKENTGNKTSKIRRGLDKIEHLMDQIYWQVAPTIIQVLITAAILFWVEWRFGLIFSVFIPIFVYITLMLNRKADPYRIKLHDDWEAESGKMTQAIININTVKSFVQEHREMKEFSELADRVRDNLNKMFAVIFRYNLGRDFIIHAGEALIIIYGVYLAWT